VRFDVWLRGDCELEPILGGSDMSIGAAEELMLAVSDWVGELGNKGKAKSPSLSSKSASSECCAKCQSEPRSGLLLRFSAPAFLCHEK
jgi:hypothetical protein